MGEQTLLALLFSGPLGESGYPINGLIQGVMSGDQIRGHHERLVEARKAYARVLGAL